ncbi:MAG: hypothetical protein IJ057_05695 [Bacteroidales bacterium]|nr:hypothetical protein [Bacteroidales bacterium]
MVARPLNQPKGRFQNWQAIDTLMWRQPESALQCLLACRDAMLASPTTPNDDSMETHAMRLYNEHYYQLLAAELLYKNDYDQTNRMELQHAVGYFDSLMALADTCGVGHYEQGDVVNACAEYLKTLEVMEAHFEERELVEHRVRFLAYTYNWLMELFSAQFMMAPAIECGEKALMFCRIEPTSPEAVSNNPYYLGKQHDKMDDIDEAKRYYGQALGKLTNTGNLVYRNIISSKALCDYQTGMRWIHLCMH